MGSIASDVEVFAQFKEESREQCGRTNGSAAWKAGGMAEATHPPAFTNEEERAAADRPEEAAAVGLPEEAAIASTKPPTKLQK